MEKQVEFVKTVFGVWGPENKRDKHQEQFPGG
jgi:hypothetical protein